MRRLPVGYRLWGIARGVSPEVPKTLYIDILTIIFEIYGVDLPPEGFYSKSCFLI